jgi:iron complex outermembrane recepter protein
MSQQKSVRSPSGRGLLAIGLACGALTAPAHAQQAETQSGGTIALETVTVEGGRERADGPVNGIVARQSATGTKTDTPLIETPQSISVVTGDQITEQAAQTPSEALRYVPGVQVERFGGDPRYDWIKIRGFDAVEYLDGLQLPRATYATPRYETYGIERIEVLKGPASVLYGQNPPGGLVNFVSKKPLDESSREVRFQVGNYGRLQAAFDLTGPVTEDKTLLYRLVGLGRISDTVVDFVDDDRAFIAPSLTWRPSESTSLTLLGYYIKDDSKSLQFLPSQGILLPNPYGKISRETFLGEPGYDNFSRRQFGIGYQFEHKFDNDVTIRQNLRYSGTDVALPVIRGFGFVSQNGVPVDYRTVNRRVVRFDDNVTGFTVDNQLQWDVATGPLSHTFLFGLDYRRFNVDYQARNGVGPTLDIFAPVYGQPFAAPPLTVSNTQELSQVGLYAQDQIKFDRFVLMLSGRNDWADTSTLNRLVARRSTQDDSEFTGRVGLLYNFDNGIAPYVSYATSFQPTIGTSFAGTPFEPTTGEQIEAGIKYQPLDTNALFTVSAYNLTQQNALIPDTLNPGFQVQQGEVRVRGLEFESKVGLADGLDLIASYAFTDSEITRGAPVVVGNEIPVTPRNQAAAWLNYAFQGGPLEGLSIGAGVRFFGNHFGDQANTLRIPSYTLVDAAIRYDFGKLNPKLAGAELALNVSNLFDNEYVSTCGDLNTCYWGNPRTVLATLSYRW